MYQPRVDLLTLPISVFLNKRWCEIFAHFQHSLRRPAQAELQRPMCVQLPAAASPSPSLSTRGISWPWGNLSSGHVGLQIWVGFCMSIAGLQALVGQMPISGIKSFDVGCEKKIHDQWDTKLYSKNGELEPFHHLKNGYQWDIKGIFEPFLPEKTGKVLGALEHAGALHAQILTMT